ncbi:histidine kinase [Aestuariibacter sp. A3R04]|uniref:sensor histidine kinase n=1 Tax=Aestuariibacter sp. A3R04 TaxID=2841571 RepID=UPI001C096EB9|nr:histidine kinase [Aestuariibacter sp. A3R04]MBU3021364.1 sensor histidine kinase [Aestuariibacter sp. A3R04]
MSGFTKISTTIVAVFISCFLVFSALVYFHIRDNIEEEMTGALSQVREMVKRNVSVSDIEAIVAPSPHLSARYFTGRIQPYQTLGVSQNGSGPIAPVIIPIQENQYLIVTPYEVAELTQNLTFFALVAGLFFATFVLLLITLKVAVKQRLVPLNQLADALSQLSEGRATQALPYSDIPEMNKVVRQFQHLQQALGAKEKQLIKIDKQLALLQEQERNYLARELHDNVGQLLTTIKAHAYILVNARERTVIEKSAQKVQVMSHQISDAVRKLTVHLHPLVLDKVSLQGSLEGLVYEQEIAHPDTRWEVSINLKNYKEDNERDIHLYRFAQEAINNVVKHANATKVSIQIYGDGHGVSLVVKDNGRGLGDHVVENIGMSSMRSRARCIGADCTVTSPSEGGVTVSLALVLNTGTPAFDADVA